MRVSSEAPSDLRQVWQWDRAFLDSDLTSDQLRARHAPDKHRAERFVYFWLDRCVGYAVFVVGPVWVELIWLVAPGVGRLALSALFSRLRREMRTEFAVLLAVQVAGAPPKATRARVRLYEHEMEFAPINVSWRADFSAIDRIWYRRWFSPELD